MKLFLLCLFAVALGLLSAPHLPPADAVTAPNHPVASVNLAMEPASFLLVGLGMAGGGLLRRRQRLTALALTANQTPLPTSGNVQELPAKRPASQTRWAFRYSNALLSPTRALAALSCAALLCTGPKAFADSFTYSAASIATTTLAPSSDTISLNDSSGTADPGNTPFLLQTGDFIIGDSEIPDQVIPFTLQDTITLNGITQVITLSGEDDVTSTADVLTLFASGPFVFGDDVLNVQSLQLDGMSMGQDLPIDLEATVSPTPEPASLLLLGTGLLGGVALLLTRKRRSTLS